MTASTTSTTSACGGRCLFAPSDSLAITASVDHTRQRPEGYTQVVAGVAPTLRPANRQYAQIAADLGYMAPSFNAFDRLTDVDSPLRSYQDLGGTSVNVDWKLRTGQVTSTTAWRYWNWNPSSDRDFIGLPVTTISAAPSKQRQWTQEVRYAGTLSTRVNLVVGAFAFHQTIDSDPVVQAGAGLGRGAIPAARRARTRRRRACSTAMATTNTSTTATPARRSSGRSPWLGDRSASIPARHPFQLRPQGRGFRSAGLWRPADDRSGADRAAAVDPRAAGVQGECERRESVRPADAGVQGSPERQRVRDLRDRIQVRRPQSERRADGRVEPAGSRGRDGEAGRHSERRSRAEDGAASRCHREHQRATTPRSGTSRHRSPTAAWA